MHWPDLTRYMRQQGRTSEWVSGRELESPSAEKERRRWIMQPLFSSAAMPTLTTTDRQEESQLNNVHRRRRWHGHENGCRGTCTMKMSVWWYEGWDACIKSSLCWRTRRSSWAPEDTTIHRGMHANPNGGSINNIRVSEWRSVDDCVPGCLPACQAKRNGTERISGILRSTTSRSPSRWPRILCILRRDEGSFFVFCLINSEIYNCMQLPSGSIELKEGGNCFTRGLISSTEKNRSTYIWDDVVPSGIPFF